MKKSKNQQLDTTGFTKWKRLMPDNRNLNVVKRFDDMEHDFHFSVKCIGIVFLLLVLCGCVSEQVKLDTENSEDLTQFKREELVAQFEDRGYDHVKYLNEPDALTKELTEFIAMISFASIPKTDFLNTIDADLDMMLRNSFLATKEVYVSNNSNDIDEFGCSTIILREHLEENAKKLYGDLVELPMQYKFAEYNENTNSYCLLGTAFQPSNPVIKEMTINDEYYECFVFLPVLDYSSEDQFLDEESVMTNSPGVALNDVIQTAKLRKMVIKRNEDQSLTLISHQFVK